MNAPAFLRQDTSRHIHHLGRPPIRWTDGFKAAVLIGLGFVAWALCLTFLAVCIGGVGLLMRLV